MPALRKVYSRLADLRDVVLGGTGWLHWGGSGVTVTTPTAADVGADAAGTAAGLVAAEASTRASADSTHAALTTTAHGGIVASTDARLTDARTPLAHAGTHASGQSDAVTPAAIGAATAADLTAHTGNVANPHAVTPLQVAGASAPSGLLVTGAQALSTFIRTANTVYLAPVVIPEAVTVTRITAEVTGAGSSGSVVRLGIYSSDAHGLPSARVLDAGTIDGTSQTVQTIVISQPLAPGLYWLAAVSQGGPLTEPTMRINSGGSPFVGYASWSATSNTGFQKTGVTGALPNPITGVSATTNSTRIALTVA